MACDRCYRERPPVGNRKTPMARHSSKGATRGRRPARTRPTAVRQASRETRAARTVRTGAQRAISGRRKSKRLRQKRDPAASPEVRFAFELIQGPSDCHIPAHCTDAIALQPTGPGSPIEQRDSRRKYQAPRSVTATSREEHRGSAIAKASRTSRKFTERDHPGFRQQRIGRPRLSVAMFARETRPTVS